MRKKTQNHRFHPGDTGLTFVPASGTVRKSDPLVAALGDLDELNCLLGLLALRLRGPRRAALVSVQENLFLAGADVALAGRRGRPRLGRSAAAALDAAIRRLDSGLPPLRGFVVPGANEPEAWCQLSRTVARRAERSAASLPGRGLNPEVPRYLNRLSSFLFSLSRSLAGRKSRSIRVR